MLANCAIAVKHESVDGETEEVQIILETRAFQITGVKSDVC
jgi:hypothetical protein